MKKRIPILRLLRINYVLVRHGLDRIILSIPLFYPLRFLSYLNPWNWHRYDKRSRGERIRSALQELGPIFVKFGQSLSTRRDLLPDDIADELALLQDRVPPFPLDDVYNIIEAEYRQPAQNIFQTFDPTPLAAASIAQVHAATLWNGQKVVVKVLRPGIEKIIRRDLNLLYALAGLTMRYWSQGYRLKPQEVVAEFENTILDEIDLMYEAANASLLRRNFAHSDMLYVPEIYWPYARHRVLVMERIYGIPISNTAELIQHHIDLKKLAELGVEIFFTQVFRDCFFHADMHPGNIFVAINDKGDPYYRAVDFGIMGTLNSTDQRYLAENLLAFFNRDYRRVAELHIESGWVPVDTRVNAFESAIRTLSEPIFERPLKDISFAQLLLQLFQAARRFDMQIQPQLVLLQKTLFQVEGLGRQLYPDLDLWSTAKPFLERWLKQQLGPQAFLNKLADNAPYWLEKLPELPNLMYTLLQQTKENALRVQSQTLQQQKRKQQVRHAKWHGFWLGFGLAVLSSGIIAGALLY